MDIFSASNLIFFLLSFSNTPRISLQQQSALSETSLGGVVEEKEVGKKPSEEESAPVSGANQWIRLLGLCSSDLPTLGLASLAAAAAGSINPLFALFLIDVSGNIALLIP